MYKIPLHTASLYAFEFRPSFKREILLSPLRSKQSKDVLTYKRQSYKRSNYTKGV